MMLALSSAMALGLAVAPTMARPRVSYLPPPPPPGYTYDTGNTSSSGNSTSTSVATCNATVSSKTWSEAKSAFADVGVKVSKIFCGTFDWKKIGSDYNQTDIDIRAMAKLVIDSKIKCDTSGKYAYACGSTWADAHSFAGAAYEAYASAWADVQGAGSDYNYCDCGVDVYAQADVVTSQFADVWVEIYNALDDTACASSYGDAYPDSVDQDKLLTCTGEVVLSAWIKAFAKLYASSDCYARKPIECEECCVDPYGEYYYQGCKQEDCQQDCEKWVHQHALAEAKVTIESAVTTNTKDCNLTGNGAWDKHWEAYKNFEYIPTINQPDDTEVKCTADTYADTWLGSWNDQAKIIKNLTHDVCEAFPGDHLYDTAEKTVKAFVDLWQYAYTNCVGTGSGDPYYDGGCALAKSYASGYAEACVEAIISVMADVSFGTKEGCDCKDVSASAHAEAVAHEVKTVFAFLEQELEARSCNPDNYGGEGIADIFRNCVAKSTADALVKYIAKVTATGNCVTAYKAEYCTEENGQCKEYWGKDGWDTCVEECTKESHIKATAYVSALAEITVNDEVYCNGTTYTTPQVAQVYVTIYNNETTTTGEPGTQTRTGGNTRPSYPGY